jgi:hypothetical protein
MGVEISEGSCALSGSVLVRPACYGLSMRTYVVEGTIEAPVARSDSPPEAEGDSARRKSTETDADKVWRQRLIRRKTTLARRAMAAYRRR